MTIALSTALASAQTSLLATELTGGFIRIFSGARPASADLAETGTLLGIVSVNGVAGAGLHFVSSGAALLKGNEQWLFFAAAAGTATWFRIVQPSDTFGNSLSAIRIDGSIGTLAAPGDMNWDTTLVTAAFPYTIDSFFYLIQPIGSS